MPVINVENLSEVGIVKDQLPMQLPPNGWSDGNNVRFDDLQVKKSDGWAEFDDPGATWDGGANKQIYYAIPYNDGSTAYWVFCGLKDVAVTDGVTIAEITNVGGDYSATAALNWTGCVLGKNVILNNGIDDPQFTSDLATPTKLADLTYWPASTTCAAMRVYKNYLIALDVTKSGTRYKSMVKWSDSAALDALPGSWDETDATTDAGETVLSERTMDVGVGAVIDCLPLRDTNIVYTDSQTWAMDFVGGTFVFNFRQIFKNNGLLSKRCVREFEGKHFCVGNNDVYVHDGNTIQSVIDQKMRKELFSAMDPTYYNRTYVFSNQTRNEMWVCYVSKGASSELPNKALIWSWRTGAWSTVDLPSTSVYGTPHISLGAVVVVDTIDAWEDGPLGAWSAYVGTWGVYTHPEYQSPLMCSDKLYRGDFGNTQAGTNMVSFIERTDLPVGLQDQFVRIKAVYPKMSGNAAVNIDIGAHMAPGDSPNYQGPVSFTPGVDQKVDARVTGTNMAIKIQSSDNQNWTLHGYEVEYEHVSRR